MAIDVAKLHPIAEFKVAADELIRALRSVETAEGFEISIDEGLHAERDAVDAGGTVGGYTPGEYRGIVWIDDIPHLLPTVPGFGNVICHGANDSGVIVGDLIDPGGMWWWSGGRAFIAEPRADGDYDGDALKDQWELQGYEHDNGTHVDLPSMGANPLRRDLTEKLRGSSLPIRKIEDIKNEVEEICGGPADKPELGEKVVAAIKWVDGTVIDCVRQVGS